MFKPNFFKSIFISTPSITLAPDRRYQPQHERMNDREIIQHWRVIACVRLFFLMDADRCRQIQSLLKVLC